MSKLMIKNFKPEHGSVIRVRWGMKFRNWSDWRISKCPIPFMWKFTCIELSDKEASLPIHAKELILTWKYFQENYGDIITEPVWYKREKKVKDLLGE